MLRTVLRESQLGGDPLRVHEVGIAPDSRLYRRSVRKSEVLGLLGLGFQAGQDQPAAKRVNDTVLPMLSTRAVQQGLAEWLNMAPRVMPRAMAVSSASAEPVEYWWRFRDSRTEASTKSSKDKIKSFLDRAREWLKVLKSAFKIFEAISDLISEIKKLW
jgi:hypothetical protein